MQLIEQTSDDKLRGGFYTPQDIAKFILKWAFNGKEDMSILEPSCGDGVFLKVLKKMKADYRSVTAIEYEKKEAEKARKVGLKKSQVINTDFHKYCLQTKDKFDLIIGNPPYIRYQYFNKEQQELADKIFKNVQLKYSKLTNAWVSFVVGASQLLKKNGKLGFVLPADLLQVTYAENLRKFLTQYYNKISIVSFETLVFPKIQQEVLLFFGEKDNTDTCRIEHIEVKDSANLKQIDINKIKTPKKKIDFHTNKWTFYFLNQKEIDFLEDLQAQSKIKKLAEYANVKVGITTGANSFFTIPLSTVKEYGLEEYAKPLVGRSVQVPSVIFTRNDWNKNRKNEARTHLLVFPKKKEMKGQGGPLKYIKHGEQNEINKGYKCRIRDEWQIIPSIRTSDALFIRRNNLYPKLILNQTKAYTTDTMHRISIKDGVDKKALIASYYNSLSLACTEIYGRSHGGGVLELMPNEVKEILIPYSKENASLIEEIDEMLRSNVGMEDVLMKTNKEILIKNYGFSKTDIKIANNIRKKLQGRRIKRGKN